MIIPTENEYYDEKCNDEIADIFHDLVCNIWMLVKEMNLYIVSEV